MPPRSCPVNRPLAESPSPGSATLNVTTPGTLMWFRGHRRRTTRRVDIHAMTPSFRRFGGTHAVHGVGAELRRFAPSGSGRAR